jgi:hypothetical protein
VRIAARRVLPAISRAVLVLASLDVGRIILAISLTVPACNLLGDSTQDDSRPNAAPTAYT